MKVKKHIAQFMGQADRAASLWSRLFPGRPAHFEVNGDAAGPKIKYYCEAFDAVTGGYVEGSRRIGGFVVTADTMSGALAKASKNIEVAIRPEQYRITVTRMKE